MMVVQRVFCAVVVFQFLGLYHVSFKLALIIPWDKDCPKKYVYM